MSIKNKARVRFEEQDREDVMSVIENNGEVTLPDSKESASISTRQLISAAVIAGSIVALVWAALDSR